MAPERAAALRSDTKIAKNTKTMKSFVGFVFFMGFVTERLTVVRLGPDGDAQVY